MSPRSFQPHESLAALGQAVRALRIERKLTQEQLAELAGVDVTYVSAIERGRRNLTWTTLKKISGAFDVTVSELARSAEDIDKDQG